MSSVVDEDTMRSLESGRQSLASTLRVVQKHLQKAFIVFIIGMLGTVYAMRLYVWDFLATNARSRIGVTDPAFGQIKIIAQTPFDVILLQVKIGIVVGIILVIPTLLFLARDSVRERISPAVPVTRMQIVALAALGLLLFAGGMVYAYTVFFPFMFEFLANNAARAGIQPMYGIVEFTEFVVFLTLSFGLAAELPLLMGAFSYSEIIPYEFWRDKWRHAVLAIFLFGALFSPPDPFTQIMWAVPLIALYGFSLGLSKVLTNLRRSAAAAPEEASGVLARKILQLGGVTVAATVAGYLLVSAGLLGAFNEAIRPALPRLIRPSPLSVESIAPVAGVAGQVYVSAMLGLAVALVVVAVFVVQVLRQPVVSRDPLRAQDPAEIDVGQLDLEGLRAAPIEAFAEMTEDEAVSAARAAMDEDDPERAQLILDRFDEAHETADGAEPAAAEAESAAAAGSDGATADDAAAEAAGESGDVVTETTAGMVDAFTEEETTEDDIGGYYWDLRFIFESLTSRMFRIVVVFLAILFTTFFGLYRGGIGFLMSQFLSRVSRDVIGRILAGGDAFTVAEVEAMSRSELVATLTERQSFVITLHPVEALIFAVKLSAIIAIIAIVPLILYYAWPALEERRLVSGDRRVFGVWGMSLVVGFLAGSVLGFFVIAPATISFLVSDALLADMVIAFRLKKFFWMVFMLTGGVGLFVDVIITVVLFHVGGIVSFETMAGRWRETVFAVFVLAIFATNKSVLTMLLFGVPFALAFLLGLGVLWLLTFRERRGASGAQPS
ncbi:MAG: sec-independent protein translocase protein TatC [Natronomonas sp.]|jgi:sec-independent protein translocase protein TatC